MIKQDNIEKENGFTCVENTFLMDERLSITERGLFVTLCSLPDYWKFSIEGLTSILPDGKAKLTAALKNLELYGYVEKKKPRDKGRFSTMLILHHQPKDGGGTMSEKRRRKNGHRKTATENQAPKNGDGKTGTENMSQSITNRNNTKEMEVNPESISQPVKLANERLIDEWTTFEKRIDSQAILGDAIKRGEQGLVADVLNVLQMIITNPKKSYPIHGQTVDGSHVREVILNFTDESLRLFLSSFPSSLANRDVRNMKGYLITSLYNFACTGQVALFNDICDDDYAAMRKSYSNY